MDWKVLEDITLSDHQYITFNINYRISEQNMVINLPKWNIRKLNITKFKNTIQRAKQMTNLTSIAADNMIVIVTEIIIQCCTSSMPKVKEYNRRREPAYWWNSNIKRLRAECLYARRRATRNRSDETLALEYRKSRKKLRLAIKNSKKGKWRELCESVDSDPWGKPYKIITKKMCGRKPIHGINEPKWAKQIVTTLFPTETQKHFNNCKMTTGNNFNPFSNEELMKASKKLKIGKSPGPDGIPNEALKLTVQFWPELLLDTYNTCFKNGIFPKCWKTQKLVLLRKGNKPLNEPSSYRPLCMINTMGKLYKSLLYARLGEEIGRNGGLSPRQYGFQKGKSTIGAIKEVTDMALSSKRKKGFCTIITLDVKNAFNTVRWKIVLDSCRRKHINPFLYNIVVDYLSDRVLLYKTDRGMERYNITAGVPQGSVLGPLLWNIMYDGLLNLDLPKGATIIGYADDVALVISHELPQALEIIANDSLNRCDRWLIENGLKLAAEKQKQS